MDRIVTRGPDGAIADPTCAIAERLLAEALQCLGDEFQMVLNGAGGDTGTHADRLAFYRYGSAGRLGHVYFSQLSQRSDYRQQGRAFALFDRFVGPLVGLPQPRF